MSSITLISLSTPTLNNIRAASALPYHLLKSLKGQYAITVYSFNINHIQESQKQQIEQELGCTISFIQRPKWLVYIFKLHLSFLRVLLRYPFLSYLKLSEQTLHEINQQSVDIIWIYGEEICGLAKHFQSKKCLVTMPDCESLYYYRLLSKRFATQKWSQVMKYATAYNKYRQWERDSFQRNTIYHFVGKADAQFYQEINPAAHVCFLCHPLYEYLDDKQIRFSQPRINLLIAGRYDIYMKESCDEALEVFIQNSKLCDYYTITFLGKDWEMWNKKLLKAGYNSQHKIFVENYAEELISYDIQMTPISVGTGTKGKVLDALANGLLVIGTRYALENIQVENGVSCIEYRNVNELLDILYDIPYHISRYEEIAINGRKAVLSHHDSFKCSHRLFQIFNQLV